MVEQVLGNRDDRSGWWRLDRLAGSRMSRAELGRRSVAAAALAGGAARRARRRDHARSEWDQEATARGSVRAAADLNRLSALARRSARLARNDARGGRSSTGSAVAVGRERRKSSAETTRKTRPCASRIVTGPMVSSPEGSRTVSEDLVMGHVSCREIAPLRPTSGCRRRDTHRGRPRSTSRNRGTGPDDPAADATYSRWPSRS